MEILNLPRNQKELHKNKNDGGKKKKRKEKKRT